MVLTTFVLIAIARMTFVLLATVQNNFVIIIRVLVMIHYHNFG
jgi:hypothetical protein